MRNTSGLGRQHRHAAHLDADTVLQPARALSGDRGGLTADGQWRAVRNGFLLPARVVMACFAAKLRAAIRQEFGARQPRTAAGQEPAAVEICSTTGPHDSGNVQSGSAIPWARGVGYLARYCAAAARQ